MFFSVYEKKMQEKLWQLKGLKKKDAESKHTPKHTASSDEL